MRTTQIETKITRLIDGELKTFTVYSDADNFSEAIVAHYKAIMDKIVETDSIPSFGRVEVYDKENILKQAEWLFHDTDGYDMTIYKCSSCGRKQFGTSKYCATCGSLMEE